MRDRIPGPSPLSLRYLEAKRRGYDDRRHGRFLGQNPYDPSGEAMAWKHWRAGWEMAKRKEGRP